jgi:hypothetical protein
LLSLKPRWPDRGASIQEPQEFEQALVSDADNALSSQLELAFDDNRLAAQLYGDFDQNLALIEQRLTSGDAARQSRDAEGRRLRGRSGPPRARIAL